MSKELSTSIPGTKHRIAAAAQQMFAVQGYEKTTMRAIARAAQVDPALVIYYFSSKQELFMRVMLPAQVQGQAAVIRSMGKVRLAQLAEELATSLADRLESKETRQLLVGIVRSAASEPMAAVLLRSQLLDHITVQFEHYFTPHEAKLCAALVGSQMVGFVYARYVVQMPALRALSRKQMIAYLVPTIRTALTMPLQ